jgi:hypothetical protein
MGETETDIFENNLLEWPKSKEVSQLNFNLVGRLNNYHKMLFDPDAAG